MINHTIAPRYAKTLFELDCQKGSVEKRLADFESLRALLKENPQLTALIRAPHVSIKDKKKIIQDLLETRFDQTFLDFIFYLIQKGRLVNVDHIAEVYRLMVNQRLGVWEAELITAIPIDSSSETTLKEKLERDFGKRIVLNKKVDSRIVGGAILVIANEMLDWSVTGRLRKLKENLISTQV